MEKLPRNFNVSLPKSLLYSMFKILKNRIAQFFFNRWEKFYFFTCATKAFNVHYSLNCGLVRIQQISRIFQFTRR